MMMMLMIPLIWHKPMLQPMLLMLLRQCQLQQRRATIFAAPALRRSQTGCFAEKYTNVL